MAEESSVAGGPVMPPEVMYAARVDEKGRLKLPEDFRRYVETLADKTFFVTSVDFTIARVYPMSVWQQNKKLMAEHNSAAAESVRRTAAYFGSVVTLDAQGRLLLSPQLRRELGLENQAVQVMLMGSVVEVYSDAYISNMLAGARLTSTGDLETLREKGFV